jgi:hypothetical protein
MGSNPARSSKWCSRQYLPRPSVLSSSFDFHKTNDYGDPPRVWGGVEMQTHHPRIIHGHDRTWVVECMECRNDTQSDLPIGIGMPLRDRETAERLRDNHALRSNRVAAS